ncbi:MAG: hypothetical protein LKG16_03555 [Bifidobacterium subtile]|nr:hypothetical protein [Bifidobacterium subtile]MCI1258290.1 hypothetical protein [Bifidobacterium subtile]
MHTIQWEVNECEGERTVKRLDYTKYDRLPNPMLSPGATIEYVEPRPVSIVSLEQLRDVISHRRKEQGLSQEDLARESLVSLRAAQLLEESGEGSIHDAIAVLTTLQIKPMVLPPALAKAAMRTQEHD